MTRTRASANTVNVYLGTEMVAAILARRISDPDWNLSAVVRQLLDPLLLLPKSPPRLQRCRRCRETARHLRSLAKDIGHPQESEVEGPNA
jgi:hypothetical protein